MPDIDFLPAEYRERRRRRKDHARRLAVVAIFAALLAAVGWTQAHRRGRIADELAALRQQHAATGRQAAELGRVQSRLRVIGAEAQLLTWLKHPWPRSRIVAAALTPLPEAAVLRELYVHRPAREAVDYRASPGGADAEGQQKLPPALRDLAKLRQREQDTLVTLSGVIDDQPALHRYLAALSRNELFTRVQLVEAESLGADDAGYRFTAQLSVLPGYGQPGGPAPDRGPNLAGEGAARR